MKNCLTIAGSDCSAGAGIQADIKAMSACGVYAMSVITSAVAENTSRVVSVYDLPSEVIKQQIDAVFEDISVDGVKIGMIKSPSIMQAVAEKLMSERDQFTNYGMDFYILSIPNKASVYPEFMPDTIETKDTTSKTDLLMKYLKENTDLNVVDAKPTLIKAKKKASLL